MLHADISAARKSLVNGRNTFVAARVQLRAFLFRIAHLSACQRQRPTSPDRRKTQLENAFRATCFRHEAYQGLDKRKTKLALAILRPVKPVFKIAFTKRERKERKERERERERGETEKYEILKYLQFNRKPSGSEDGIAANRHRHLCCRSVCALN